MGKWQCVSLAKYEHLAVRGCYYAFLMHFEHHKEQWGSGSGFPYLAIRAVGKWQWVSLPSYKSSGEVAVGGFLT